MKNHKTHILKLTLQDCKMLVKGESISTKCASCGLAVELINDENKETKND